MKNNSGIGSGYFYDIWGSPEGDVFALGFSCISSIPPYSKIILRYDGYSWTQMQTFSEGYGYEVIKGTSENNIFVPYSSGIFHYDGTAWTEMETGTSNRINGIWISPENEVIAVGDIGTILSYSPLKNNPVLLVSSASQTTPDSYNIPASYGNLSITVENTGTGTMNWVAEENTDWFSVSPTSGANNSTITVTYNANTGVERTGTIRITAEGAANSPRYIQVVQQAGISDSQVMYFPHIASNIGDWETEICIINTGSDKTITGNLKSYDNKGNKVSVSRSLTLKPHARTQITVGYEFANPENIGYMVFESDSSYIAGYTKFYITGKYRVAVPAVKESSTGDIYISHIASDENWWTGISLVNTTSSSKTLNIEFDNGDIKTKTLSAAEHQAFMISDLFDGNPPVDLKSAVIKNAAGIAGLELFASTDNSGNNYLEGIPLTDDTASDIYYPHIASR